MSNMPMPQPCFITFSNQAIDFRINTMQVKHVHIINSFTNKVSFSRVFPGDEADFWLKGDFQSFVTELSYAQQIMF